MKEEKAKYNA
jgi:hypothetical protein